MAVRPTRTTVAGARHREGMAAAATDEGAAAQGAVAAAGLEAGAVPGPGAALATAAPSLGPAPGPARGPPPSPGLREDPSPSRPRSPDPARGPGPGRDPEVLRPCPRGSPSLGRVLRVPPSLQRKKEQCPPKKTVMSAGIRDAA